MNLKEFRNLLPVELTADYYISNQYDSNNKMFTYTFYLKIYNVSQFIEIFKAKLNNNEDYDIAKAKSIREVTVVQQISNVASSPLILNVEEKEKQEQLLINQFIANCIEHGFNEFYNSQGG